MTTGVERLGGRRSVLRTPTAAEEEEEGEGSGAGDETDADTGVAGVRGSRIGWLMVAVLVRPVDG
ncbi:predicted protein [Streptomyces viridosporus ATCC 14672]|uniref:Predicted protein n=1 Tax=Streptomyces viridosporus (strain ATCC 14672 / DSM 40746 / JCM 4963 / KCTC 9882 / NRRL B-12104 / FH 1290) TaxID=566461 RepID=D5ZQR2_STRV1|nr:predicted protein [Streptomyces viridosporus ATCC 14672]